MTDAARHENAMSTDDMERRVTCQHCFLTYDKHDIQEGEMTRCPRCDGLVVA